MSHATLQRHGPVGVITLRNPPVNSLSHAHRASILECLREAEADPAVDSVVLIGAGDAFCGGAEIREFNTPKSLAEPITRQVAETAENLRKPVIAAVHKVAMGGGLELALGCHYRVAVPGAAIALPEVKLGLLPGAGGTQRLPRAIGVAAALDMIVSGNAVNSEKLAPLGLFDEIVEGDLLAGALAFARRIVAEGKPRRRLRDEGARGERLEELFAAQRERVAREMRGYPAPPRCIDAVEAAVQRPFDEGMRFERECFLELVQTTASKAMRHAFFAERAAARIPDVPADTPALPVQRVAVIGAGTMGSGIAMVFANAGLPVSLIDSSTESLERGLRTIRGNYDTAVARQRLHAAERDERMALIAPAASIDELSGAQLAIEAVFEDMAVKQDVLRRLESVLGEEAIIASNTSTLDLDALAGVLRRPERSIGLHFFSPAPVMRLLEVVRGARTSARTLATAMALARRIRKVAVVARVCDGFIGNRMLEEYLRQAYAVVDEGALPREVDAALEDFGMAMGPFRMMDMAGQDIGWAVRKRLARERPEKRYSKWPDLVCERGWYGQKTGRGIYRYAAGSRTPVPDEEVEALIQQASREQGIARRPVARREIVERCIYALINEGARILEEGIAQRASDIDVVYLTGYGFPGYRGGPMFYADTVGAGEVVRALEAYRPAHMGSFLDPAPLLRRLAQEGSRFS